LARSFGYFNTDDELEESIENSDNSGITETEDEEREVREVVESYRIEDNSTSTGEGQRSELFTTMTNSAKEKKDAKRNIHEENET
jgi:hypothetical protein